LYFGGETLNLITMGGLALGVGLIVDNAIVVLENIYRHRLEGRGLLEAAKTGTDEVGGAVIASTLTIMAVFLPIIFTGGLAAEVFQPMSWTVAFSIFASLLVALTLVPLMASRWLHLEEYTEKQGFAARYYRTSGRWLTGLDSWYRRLLAWSLGHRRRVLLAVGALFVLSIAALALVGFEFMPTMDQGYVQITVEMPKGTSLAETNEVALRLEETAAGVPEVKRIFTSVGFTGQEGMMGAGSTDQAQIGLDLGSKRERSRTDQEIAAELRQKVAALPGAEIKVEAVDPAFQMPGSSAPIQLQIYGDDLDTLARLGDQVVDLVKQVRGTSEVKSSLEEGRPEVQILVARDRAAAYGLSPAEIAATVRTAIDGVVATRYRTGGEEVDIRV
ncbi:MAG: efflux RND transporter permease subunit, partial [Moorella sp. (in: Bacteria)]|nr:efflux RND transporter permease subunit [Moorella sp. (in: firmicutes)]